jgi:hypothetical protein
LPRQALPFRRVWCLFEVIAWILADGQDADARDTKKRRKQRPVHLRIGTVGGVPLLAVTHRYSPLLKAALRIGTVGGVPLLTVPHRSSTGNNRS